jgi:hypothetical protein
VAQVLSSGAYSLSEEEIRQLLTQFEVRLGRAGARRGAGAAGCLQTWLLGLGA